MPLLQLIMMKQGHVALDIEKLPVDKDTPALEHIHILFAQVLMEIAIPPPVYVIGGE